MLNLRFFLVMYYFKQQSTVKQNLKARNVYLMVCFYQRGGGGCRYMVSQKTWELSDDFYIVLEINVAFFSLTQ